MKEGETRRFAEGELWGRILAVSAKSLASGALQPIDTSFQTLVDRGVPFIVRSVVRMPAKPTPHSTSATGQRQNPFLPYDPDLYVGDASATHVCLLNKYPVVPHHLLMVTRQFEHQESILSAADFLALWRCMAEFDGLAFYNSGLVAGASQPHKHLQLVPLPLGQQPPPVPIETLLQGGEQEAGRVVQADQIPFSHAVVFWDSDLITRSKQAADMTRAWYCQMLERLAIRPLPGVPAKLSRPYNLLITRHWMMMVPRRVECFHGLSFNALAFAGALLVQNQQQFCQLETTGPFNAIQSVAESTA